MMSARALMRSAPGVIGRLSTTAARRTTTTTPSLARSGAALLRSQFSPARSRVAAFSTSLLRAAKADAGPSADAELSQKLEEEIQFETEIKENEPVPASIKDFLENGPFELQDTPGRQEVVLTRKYGHDEKITISFSIADLANYDPDMFDDDPALDDDDLDDDSAAAKPSSQQQQSSSRRGAAAVEEGDEGDEEGDDADDADDQPPPPYMLKVVVEKPGRGALNIEAMAQDSGVVVKNLYYFPDAADAHAASPEAEHRARDVYPGPPFGTLDEDLQVLMERYLEERGVASAMAVFVPDYMDLKEQREYLAWLHSVKGFVDA